MNRIDIGTLIRVCNLLNRDREMHLKSHGKWTLDPGKLRAALSVSDPKAVALQAFIDTINATGGVSQTPKGVVPVAAESWLDLGAAYKEACVALDCEPVVANAAEEDGIQ